MFFTKLTLAALIPALVLGIPAPAITPAPLAKRATSQLIYSGRDNLCLSLQGGINRVSPNGTVDVSDGVPVESLPCDVATVWDISPGSGSVLVSSQNPNVPRFALDAGTDPENGGPLKVWTSYPGLYQQTWYLTDDNRIAITGGTQCLDEGDFGVQLWQCTTGNTNQIWYVTTPTPRNDPVPSRTINY